MRLFKLIGMLFVLVLSVSAVISASASAAEFLDNVTGNTFTAKSGAGELVDPATKLAIKCKKDLVELVNGKVTGAKTIETTVDFEECTLAGLSAKSLGDPAGIILVTAKGTLCDVNKAEKKVGMEFAITPVHIEVPSIGELVEVTGSTFGKVEPVGTLQTTGKLTINEATSKEKCEGGKATELKLEKEHNGKPLASIESTVEELTFDKDILVDA